MPAEFVYSLSSVMVGLDPTIHAPSAAVDPRVKPEDDVSGEEGLLLLFIV